MNRPWLNFYDEGVPHRLEYPSITVPEYLHQSARRYPTQVATMFLGSRLTYRQLKAQVDHLASHLYQMGVRKGDRVAIMLPNCPHTVIAYYDDTITDASDDRFQFLALKFGVFIKPGILNGNRCIICQCGN